MLNRIAMIIAYNKIGEEVGAMYLVDGMTIPFATSSKQWAVKQKAGSWNEHDYYTLPVDRWKKYTKQTSSAVRFQRVMVEARIGE